MPSENQGTRSEPDLFHGESTRSSQNIRKVPINPYSRDAYQENYAHSSIDAYPYQNDDAYINDHPSRCFRKLNLRTLNIFKDRPKKEQHFSERTSDRTILLQDLTRVVEEESRVQPSRLSCMSVLEEYYFEAVTKRNIMRDLRRELQLSDLSEDNPRGYPNYQRREQQHFRRIHEQGSDPKHRQSLFTLTEDLNVSSTPNSEHVLGNGPQSLSKDHTASSRTAPLYTPRWDNEGNITSEKEMPKLVTHQACGETTHLPSRHVPQKIPQTPQPTRQSLINDHLIWQQCQNSSRAPGTVFSSDSEPTNLTPKQQSILRILEKQRQFLHQPQNPLSTPPLQCKDMLMSPSRPSHIARSQSSVPVCPSANEAIASTVDTSALGNGQLVQSCKEDNQMQSTQFIHNESRIYSPDIDKDLLNPVACDAAPLYSHELTTPKSSPGRDSKASSICEKETHQRPDSTSVKIPEKPADKDDPVHPKPTLSVHQKLRCNLCFSTFATEKAYTKHMADEHKETKPHICGFCGKGFHDKFDLKRHHRTHTGVRPYKCSICPRAFTQRCSLETHVNKVHDMKLNFAFKERRKKIYVCEHCGNSVNEAFEHYLHMWAVHSRLAMPKRLRQKVLQRIKHILKTRNGGEKVGDELLANAQVVTQSICSLRELG